MSKDCPYGQYKKNGTRSWIYCNKMNGICIFQRYCINKRQVVYTVDADKCKMRVSNGK